MGTVRSEKENRPRSMHRIETKNTRRRQWAILNVIKRAHKFPVGFGEIVVLPRTAQSTLIARKI